MSGIEKWTSDMKDNLRRLWEEGHTTAEIGRRLNVSKNSIVGKAHRLDLIQRPSPIRAKLAATELRKTAAFEGMTLPPLASADPGPSSAWSAWCGQLPASVFNQMRRAPHKSFCPVCSQRLSLRLWECTCGVSQPGSEVGTLTKSQVVSEPVAAIVVRRAQAELIVTVEPPPAVFKPRRQTPCCWIDGNDKRTFVHCDEPAIIGRPFCQAHAARAYVKTRTRADDAIADQPAA